MIGKLLKIGLGLWAYATFTRYVREHKGLGVSNPRAFANTRPPAS